MKSFRFCVFCALLSALILWLLRYSESSTCAQSPAAPVSFINDVAPILKDYCFACHDAKKRSGKYEMTTFARLIAGGSNGETVSPGKPQESDLYDLMVTNEDRRMPPRKDGISAVPKEKAEIVRRWIEQGAKLDSGIDTKSDLVKELRVRWQPPASPTQYKFAMPVTALAFTPDGKELVAGGHHELTVWNVDSSKLTKRLRTRAERALAMLFHRDGSLIVAGSRPGQEGDIRVYNLQAAGKKEGEVIFLDGVSDPQVFRKQLLDSDDSILCLAISPDGNLLAAGGCDRTIRVWDVSAGARRAKLEQVIDNHADWVFALAFDATGERLLSCARDKTAKIWDLMNRESITTFPEHQNNVYGVAWSKDGKKAFSAGADHVLRQWEAVPQGKQLKVLGGHNEDILKLLSSPDRLLLATAGADKTVKIWEAETQKNTKTLSGLTDQVYSLALSPDGKLLAAGDYNGEVRIWNLADAKLVKGFNASPGIATISKK
ncbi:hypothetical protein KIH39_24970 [Telmatocola sphagniphila]|uniref:Cytochrome C Planctomycete-type domain-containing protein n=1 Tax=Telmatocola sphagniphila TaxID=1123043 RepID=A0A8E6B688_9BACT|nr:c-type cytochrome domain-containing protein [Telmatocola sphagniphila]QVL32049.1 hypothetical protein KIH39_24970 [Telmatocola sphagniphila]